MHVGAKPPEAVVGRVRSPSAVRSRLPDKAVPVREAELAAPIGAAQMVHGPPIMDRSVGTSRPVTRQMSRLHGRATIPAPDLGGIVRAAVAGGHATIRTQ